MAGFAYAISPTLLALLARVDALRGTILLTPISPKTEMQLKWEAMLNRVYLSESLKDGDTVDREQIVKYMVAQSKRPTEVESRVDGYRRAFNYIASEWLVRSDRVTSDVLESLSDLISQPASARKLSVILTEKKSYFSQVFEYLASQREHPVVQAAIAFLGVAGVYGSVPEGQDIGRLLSYLYFYKNGYDFRGLLVLEEFWHKNRDVAAEAFKHGVTGTTQTLWLEFFAEMAVQQLEATAERVGGPHDISVRPRGVPSTYWDLNDRQKEILNLFTDPLMTVNNALVQKKFKISQITASRDLAKLESLGLLFSHGKGRSVRYSRV